MKSGELAVARWRNLYKLDFECLSDRAGTRSLTGYANTHDNTGFLGAGACTTSNSVAKASSGITQDGGTWYWASGQHRKTLTAYSGDREHPDRSIVNTQIGAS